MLDAAVLKNDAGDGGLPRSRSRGAKVSFCGCVRDSVILLVPVRVKYASDDRVLDEDVLGRGGAGSMSDVREDEVLGRG